MSDLGALLRRAKDNFASYQDLNTRAKAKLALVWVDVYRWVKGSLEVGNYDTAKDACKDMATSLGTTPGTVEVYRRYGQFVTENKVNPEKAGANAIKAASNAERSVCTATRLKILDAVKKGGTAADVGILRRDDRPQVSLRADMLDLLELAKKVHGHGVTVAILAADMTIIKQVGP